MKIVYVSPFIRIPPDYGLAIRNFHVLKHLIEAHTVFVITYFDQGGEGTDKTLLTWGCRKVYRLPYAFPRGNYSVDFLSRIINLFEYPPKYFKRFNPRGLADFLNNFLLENSDINIILFDTQLSGQVLLRKRLRECSVLILADVYDLALFRKLKIFGFRPSSLFVVSEWIKTALYERKILSCFSWIMSVSDDEKRIIEKRNSKAKVILSPNGVDVNFFSPDLNAIRSEGVKNLLFVGSFTYGPNVDAFFYFHKEILPMVRSHFSSINFIVAGSNPTPEMKRVAELDPFVEVTGTVVDLRPFYKRADVVVIPLRMGTGTKLKTLEAFAMGKPVVSSRVGCEGIDVSSGKQLLIAENPSDFAQSILLLLKNPPRGEALGREARQLVEQKYDWKIIARNFVQSLESFVL